MRDHAFKRLPLVSVLATLLVFPCSSQAPKEGVPFGVDAVQNAKVSLAALRDLNQELAPAALAQFLKGAHINCGDCTFNASLVKSALLTKRKVLLLQLTPDDFGSRVLVVVDASDKAITGGYSLLPRALKTADAKREFNKSVRAEKLRDVSEPELLALAYLYLAMCGVEYYPDENLPQFRPTYSKGQDSSTIAVLSETSDGKKQRWKLNFERDGTLRKVKTSKPT